MSKLTCVHRRSLEIRPEAGLLVRQQLKDFPASGGTGPFVRKHAIKGNVLPGEKSVQTHAIHVTVMPRFPASRPFHLLFLCTSFPLPGVCARQPFNGTARSDLRQRGVTFAGFAGKPAPTPVRGFRGRRPSPATPPSCPGHCRGFAHDDGADAQARTIR